ncbi:MAG: ATP-binding protein [SAR324 cluster bacterium]|nr:ATP-binding protein [SAR324 cluster bacterium]MBF0353217.1 ATP-binding protein [SAR324 cluster bacterium]
MLESPQACLRCQSTYILVECISNVQYAKASICTCFSRPCAICQGTRFIFHRDKHGRDLALPCPTCEPLRHKVNLYNGARIPKKYASSRMDPQEKDDSNKMAYMYLQTILKNLEPGQQASPQGDEPEDGLKGLMLMGTPGTGKTHLMAGFAYLCTIQLGISCVCQGFSELLSELRKAYSDGLSEMEVIEPHLRADVLIIDDLGKGRNTDWELMILDTLITERYNRNKIIMATSNYTEHTNTTLKERILTKDKSDVEKFTEDTLRKRVGERIYSRLKEMCYFEHLLGQDRRNLQDYGD